MSDHGTCKSCNGSIVFGRTIPGKKLMPLEHRGDSVPADVLRNVIMFRHSGGRTDCRVLTQAQAERVRDGETLEQVLPDLVNAQYWNLTVAHFVTCPAASAHRKARRGEVKGVVPFPSPAERVRRQTRTQEPLL